MGHNSIFLLYCRERDKAESTETVVQFELSDGVHSASSVVQYAVSIMYLTDPLLNNVPHCVAVLLWWPSMMDRLLILEWELERMTKSTSQSSNWQEYT